MLDAIVIGSGLTALAASASLAQKPRLRMKVISTDTRNVSRPFLFGLPTYTRSEELGGLGRYWHNVVALENYAAADRPLLCSLIHDYYGADVTEFVGKPYNFVPRITLRPNRKFNQARLRSHLITGKVSRIDLERGQVRVSLESGTRYSAKKVFLAAGCFSSADILVRSGLAKYSSSVSDHLNGYVGTISADDLPRYKRMPGPYRMRGGFVDSFLHDHRLNANLTFRPARGALVGADVNQLKGIYSNSTFAIFKRLLRSGSASLILEALYNRYGIFPKSNHYNVFIQVPFPDGLHYDGRELEVDEQKYLQLVETIRANLPMPSIDGISLSSAIHFSHSVSGHASVVGTLCDDPTLPITVCDSSLNGSATTANHFTFLLMLKAHALAQIYLAS